MGGDSMMRAMEFFMCVACAAAASACLAAVVHRRRTRASLWRKGGVEDHPAADEQAVHLLARLSHLLPASAPRWLSPGMRGSLEVLLLAAGAGDQLDLRALMAAVAASAAAGIVWAGFVMAGPVPLRIAFGVVAGAMAPLAWLRARARRRLGAIERALPGALDWLALSVEAGEGFAQALARIAVQMAPGPLRDELVRLDAALRMGSTRRDALTAMRRRLQVPAVSSLVALLIQADLLGTGIAPVLRVQAERLRRERFARAERAGVVAAEKALVPLVLCIMPATFVVVFGPLAVRVATGGIAALFSP